GDQSRLVRWQRVVQSLPHCNREALEHFPLFHRSHTLEGVDVVRMHREQANEFVHAFVHVAVELGEWQQIVPNLCLLRWRLSQESFRNDKLHVAPRDQDLLEAILHAPHTLCNERKSRAVENGFLDTGDESESQIFADLA